jgi:hypothetical protein
MKSALLTTVLPSPVVTLFAVISLSITFVSANAAEPGDEESQTEKLAKETQNPIADLISVPFQNNFNFRLGKLPVNASLAAYSNVVKPRQGGSDWQLRFQLQFLFPK